VQLVFKISNLHGPDPPTSQTDGRTDRRTDDIQYQYRALHYSASRGKNWRNKTAELSQRRPRDAPNIWVPWKVLRVLTTHPATFPEICNGLFFRPILRMCVQNLKFVALPVPEIIGGTQKISAVPGYAHPPFSPKILKGFCSDWPVNIPAKFDVRSFTHSWDNRGYCKNLGSPWIRPRSLFSQSFKRLLFAWTLWIYLPSLIIGGTQKIWAVPVYAHAPFSPKFLIGFWSHGLSEYICKIWRS